MEAVKQGGATVGCKVFSLLPFQKFPFNTWFSQSKEYVVLATLKRAASELSSSQQKIFRADEAIGVAISGLTADGTAAIKALRRDCISHSFTFQSQVEVCRLAGRIADKWQVCSQRAGSRPSGVGLLIAGRDTQGCHLYQVCPSGNLYDHVATAIGARSQASKTYLEKFHFQMDNLPLKDIILLALRALKEATSEPLTKDTCTIAVVGVEMPFRVLDEDELRSPLAELAADTR